MLCPRKKVFEIVNPKNQSYQTTVRTAAGQGLHRLMQKQLKKSDPEAYESEMPVEYKNFVYGSIDVYDKRCDVVIKTKEKIVNGPWDLRPHSSHEEQLMSLMAMNNTSRGVIVLIILDKTDQVKQFNYFMTEEQKKRQLMKLEENADSFLNAKNGRNPGLAQHVFFDRNLKWLCSKTDKKSGEDVLCPYYWECLAMIVEKKKKEDVSYYISGEVERITQKPPPTYENNENNDGYP